MKFAGWQKNLHPWDRSLSLSLQRALTRAVRDCGGQKVVFLILLGIQPQPWGSPFYGYNVCVFFFFDISGGRTLYEMNSPGHTPQKHMYIEW